MHTDTTTTDLRLGMAPIYGLAVALTLIAGVAATQTQLLPWQAAHEELTKLAKGIDRNGPCNANAVPNNTSYEWNVGDLFKGHAPLQTKTTIELLTRGLGPTLYRSGRALITIEGTNKAGHNYSISYPSQNCTYGPAAG